MRSDSGWYLVRKSQSCGRCTRGGNSGTGRGRISGKVCSAEIACSIRRSGAMDATVAWTNDGTDIGVSGEGSVLRGVNRREQAAII